MTDFVNQNMAVANPDADGLYPWMSVRSGGNSNVFGNLQVVRPLNMGGRFVYNAAGVDSASMSKYNNTVESGATAVNGVVPIPNTVPLTVDNQTAGQITADGTTSAVTQVAGTNLVAYCRLTLTSASADGANDQIRVGFQVNGAGAVDSPQTVTVPALGATPVQVVCQTAAAGVAVAAGQTLRVTVENLTAVGRGVVCSNYQFIVRHP